MNDSILTSIKKLLGIAEEDLSFDQDILLFINTSITVLTQLGVGPSDGFIVTDETTVWKDFIGDNKKLESVKSYVYLKVKTLFDPSSSGIVTEAYNNLLKELEWRLALTAEKEAETESRYPTKVLPDEMNDGEGDE